MDQPLARAEVRAQRLPLEQAGYFASGREPNYPTDFLTARIRWKPLPKFSTHASLHAGASTLD